MKNAADIATDFAAIQAREQELEQALADLFAYTRTLLIHPETY